MKKSLFIKTAVALALAAPLLASAESELVTGNATVTGADARLNFSVIIPKVLFLRVGLPGQNNIDTLTYDYTSNPVDVGTGADSASQSVVVSVLGNNGTVEIAATGAPAGLSNGTDSIAWSEIVATSDDATNLNVPAVNGAAIIPAASGNITNQSTNWNFAYSNTNVVAPGTYTGQITYTATMP